MSNRETQPVTVRPRCCATGDEYITVYAANLMHGPDQTGWAIPIHREYGDQIVENVKFCPFCGKPLQ
jgi:hypothetical protein